MIPDDLAGGVVHQGASREAGEDDDGVPGVGAVHLVLVGVDQGPVEVTGDEGPAHHVPDDGAPADAADADAAHVHRAP